MARDEYPAVLGFVILVDVCGPRRLCTRQSTSVGEDPKRRTTVTAARHVHACTAELAPPRTAGLDELHIPSHPLGRWRGPTSATRRARPTSIERAFQASRLRCKPASSSDSATFHVQARASQGPAPLLCFVQQKLAARALASPPLTFEAVLITVIEFGLALSCEIVVAFVGSRLAAAARARRKGAQAGISPTSLLLAPLHTGAIGLLFFATSRLLNPCPPCSLGLRPPPGAPLEAPGLLLGAGGGAEGRPLRVWAACVALLFLDTARARFRTDLLSNTPPPGESDSPAPRSSEAAGGVHPALALLASARTPLELAPALFSTCVAAPAVEEWYYRRLLMERFAAVTRSWPLAAALASLLFGIAHTARGAVANWEYRLAASLAADELREREAALLDRLALLEAYARADCGALFAALDAAHAGGRGAALALSSDLRELLRQRRLELEGRERDLALTGAEAAAAAAAAAREDALSLVGKLRPDGLDGALATLDEAALESARVAAAAAAAHAAAARADLDRTRSTAREQSDVQHVLGGASRYLPLAALLSAAYLIAPRRLPLPFALHAAYNALVCLKWLAALRRR